MVTRYVPPAISTSAKLPGRLKKLKLSQQTIYKGSTICNCVIADFGKLADPGVDPLWLFTKYAPPAFSTSAKLPERLEKLELSLTDYIQGIYHL